METQQHGKHWKELLPRYILTLNHATESGYPKGVLTYPFAEPEEQVSGLTNQYIPKSASGEHVTLVASTYGKGAMRTVRNANSVVAH